MVKRDWSNICLWAARVLGIAFAAFLLLFSFDAFDGAQSAWAGLLGFLIHSLPSLIILSVVVVSWKRADFGAYGFFAIALIFTVFFGTYRNIWSFALISLPLALVGGLFICAHTMRKKND